MERTGEVKGKETGNIVKDNALKASTSPRSYRRYCKFWLTMALAVYEVIIMKPDKLTPGKKAQHTAKWARTMTKWLITYNHRTGAKWNLVGFGGKTGAEARGIIDLIAIRKDHRKDTSGLKRGDLLDIVLIQTKGGSAPRPTEEDRVRLSRVAKYHRARAVVLAEWKRREKLNLFKLEGTEWSSDPVPPAAIFG